MEIPDARYQDAETAIDATTWKTSKSGVKNVALATLGSNGLAVDYTISSTRSPYVKLSKTLPLWSRPDSIEIQLNPGDATIKQITVQVSPSQGARAVNVTINPTLTANAVNHIQIPVGEKNGETAIGFYKLNTNEIYVGQQLILSNDKNTEEYDVYTVKKGDSLWSISQKYNISVKELIELNNLNNLTLQINQKLKVPKTIIIEPERREINILEKNDTLWSISRKFNISVNELKELNNLTSNLLSIGQELKIKRTL